MITLIGNSHLSAIGFAAKGWRVPHQILQMTAAHLPPFRANGAALELNPAIGDLLSAKLGEATTLVSSIGGNGHNIFGLVEHPEPFYIFDNVVKDAKPGRRLLPRALVKNALKARIRGWLRLIGEVRGRSSARMLHLSPPPPVESQDHIRAFPGPFAEQIATNGIAPNYLRLSLWRLHVELLEEFCLDHGVEFVPAPLDCFTDTGFLKDNLTARDPSHANPTYGSLVLRQLEALTQ